MSVSAHRSWGSPARAHDEDEGADGEAKILLTMTQAARRLSIGRSLMYELVASGQIESIHLGRLHRIPAEALTAFVARRRDHEVA